jgi:acetolactate synthase-1/2/3 large subunit
MTEAAVRTSSEHGGPVTAAHPTRYVSDQLVDLLRGLGCRYLPLTPGASFRGLHDSVMAAERRGEIRHLLCLHEEVAVSMAHGYAKASGDVGFAVVHDLVGVLHASMAVYNAWRDRVPLVLLGGSGPAAPAARRPVEWIHSAAEQGRPLADYVKWTAEPADPAELLAAVARAHCIASTPPCGPVYVSVDCALQEQEVDAGPAAAGPGAEPHPVPRSAPAPDPLTRAVTALIEARSPAVLGGPNCRSDELGSLLLTVAELLGAAAVDGWQNVVFPSASPLSAEAEALRRADVVLRVDMSNADAALAGLPTQAADRCDTFRLIDLSPAGTGASGWARAHGPDVTIDIPLVGDPAIGLRQLLDALSSDQRMQEPGWRADRDRRMAELAARHRERRNTELRELHARWDDVPISAARLVGELWTAVRERPWSLVLRNDRSWPAGLWEFPGAGRYLGGSGGGGVGYGPGAMIGGALAARDQQRLAVAIIGDGDLLMAPTALWTAAAHRIPILIVVNNNRSYHNDEAHQRSVARQRGRPEANARLGTRIDDPVVHMPLLAESFGVWSGESITDPVALSAAFRDALAVVDAGRPALVDVITAGVG